MPRNSEGKVVCWPCYEGRHECDGSTYAEGEFFRVVACECSENNCSADSQDEDEPGGDE